MGGCYDSRSCSLSLRLQLTWELCSFLLLHCLAFCVVNCTVPAVMGNANVLVVKFAVQVPCAVLKTVPRQRGRNQNTSFAFPASEFDGGIV